MEMDKKMLAGQLVNLTLTWPIVVGSDPIKATQFQPKPLFHLSHLATSSLLCLFLLT